jgi:hypothetical protein
MMTELQALMYAVSAAVSALFFATWWRSDDDLKSRVWRRYGWFSALSFVGSVGGVVIAAADIQFRYNFQRVSVLFVSNNISQSVLLLANGSYWFAVSPVPYAIEFMCLCYAKLLVRAHSFLDPNIPALYCNRSLIVIRLLSGWWSLLPWDSSFTVDCPTDCFALLSFASQF